MSKTSVKTFAVLTALILVLAAGSNVCAQASLGMDLRGGLAVPVGDLNDSHNLGFGANGSFYVAFSPVAAAGLGVGYHTFPRDEDFGLLPGETVSGGDVGILHVTPELRFMVGAADMPTFSGTIGLGLYRLSNEAMTITDAHGGVTAIGSSDTSEFGVNIAARVLFPVSDNMKLGLEAMDHLIFVDSETTSFFTFSVVLNFHGGY